jgi:hypothetical protein
MTGHFLMLAAAIAVMASPGWAGDLPGSAGPRPSGSHDSGALSDDDDLAAAPPAGEVVVVAARALHGATP